MSEREASVKLTLDDGQFVASMRKVGDATEAETRKMAKGARTFGTEIKGAERELKGATAAVRGLGGAAGKAIGLVTGLAGGLTLGSAVKGAVELDSRFKQLAFRVGTASGKLVKHTEIQRLAEQAAARTGRRTVEMADAYEQLFAATGDRDFADNMLETIGEARSATGQSIEVLTQLADQMHTKFGVTADEMGDVFAQVFEAAQKGGPSFEEFAGIASSLGAELLNAGMRGRQGLDFMLGALVKTDDEMKNLTAQTKGIKQILLSLGDANQIKGIAKALAIDPKKLLNEKDLMARMRKVLGMGPKGLAALKGSMHEAEEQKALRILFTDPFEQALAEAQASGLKGKAAIDKALGVLDAGIGEFGKATLDGAGLQKEAAKRMKDPEARLTAALETLERSFAQPEIIEAIDSLAQYLPRIAKTFGSFAKFVAHNPLLSAALGVGGKIGGGLASEAIGEAIKAALTGGKGGRGAGGAASALAEAATAGLERHQQFEGIEGGLTEAMLRGGDGAAGKLEKGFLSGATVMGTAIQAAAIAAAAAAAYEIGKEQIDNAFGEDAQTTGDLAAAEAGASGSGGSIKTQQAQAQRLRAAITAKQNDQGGFFRTLFGAMASGSSGNVDEMGNPIGTSDSPLDLNNQGAAQIDQAQKTLETKEARIAKLIADRNAASSKAAAAAVDGKAVGQAVSDKLKSGPALKVEVINHPQAPGKAGGGGSRGPARPAPAASSGGI